MSQELAPKVAAMQITPSLPRPDPKMKPGTIGTKTNVVTNTHQLELSNTTYYLYDFRVSAVFLAPSGEKKEKEITKQTKDDFNEQDRKRVAMVVFKKTSSDGKLGNGPFAYDRAAVLFSVSKAPGIGEDGIAFDYTLAQLPGLSKIESVSEAIAIRVRIKLTNSSVTTADLKQCAAKNDEQGLILALNLATSMPLFCEDNKWVVYGNGTAYCLQEPPRECRFDPRVTRDKYIGFGVQKSVRAIEGTDGKVAAGLSIDVKKSLFHADHQKLEDKIQDSIPNTRPNEWLGKRHELQNAVMGLYVYTTFPNQKRKQFFKISGVTPARFADVTFVSEKTKQRSRAVEHIQKTYGVNLGNSPYPGVTNIQGFSFPIEYLTVAPDQRVTPNQSNRICTDKLIRQCAVLPSDRLVQTSYVSGQMGLASEQMKACGIRVPPTPIQVEGRVLPAVTMMFGGNRTMAANGGKWSMGQGFVKAVPLQNWALYYMGPGRQDTPDLGSVGGALSQGAKRQGMNIAQPYTEYVNLTSQIRLENAVEKIFEECVKEGGVQLILVVSEDHVKNHGEEDKVAFADLIKAAERKYGIVSMQLTTRVAKDVAANKGATIENVLKKVNEKIGGQNIALSTNSPHLPQWLSNPATLVMGLIIQNPSRAKKTELLAGSLPSRPAMIGYGFNCVDTDKGPVGNLHFSGGFIYANPKEFEDMPQPIEPLYSTTLRDLFISVFRAFMKQRGIQSIGTLIILRGGVNEGDYAELASHERGILRQAMQAVQKALPQIAVATVNTAHSDRFYRHNVASLASERAPGQNLPAGTVVDKAVVAADYTEAYIQSHTPLQGTAKAPRYVLQMQMPKTVFNTDTFEMTMHSLTHLHAVCNSTTAIPTPLYVAKETTKRATDQFNNYIRTRGDAWTVAGLNSDTDGISQAPGQGVTGRRFNA